MKISKYIPILALLISTSASAGQHGSSSIYKVGAWTNDISPTATEAAASCQGGYGAPFSRCGNTEILDPITVRSLAISDSDTEVIFTVIDTIGVGDSVIAEIKDTVWNLTSGAIEKESIQVTATHTHAGPDLQGLWGSISPEYRQRIINEAALSVILAKFTAEDATIGALSIEDAANVENRRGWDDVDDSIRVLDARAIYSRKRIATLVNVSAHPTILDETNLAYSSGYVHVVRSSIERRLGGKAIFINGILGDAQPNTNNERTYQAMKRFGKSIVKKVVRNIRHAEPVSGDFAFETHQFTHPVTNGPVIGAVQAGLLDLELDVNFNVNTQFSLMSFGNDVSAVLFPGEALTRLALPIIDELENDHTFFFGLADDSLGYFIPSDEFLTIPNRDTEERVSLDLNVGDSIQTAILNAID